VNVSDFNIVGQSIEKDDPRNSHFDGRVSNLRNSAGLSAAEDKKLREACQEFESFFMYLVMKEMRKTVPETELFHGGKAEEIFRDMLDEEMAKEMSKPSVGGFGLGQMLYQQLARPGVKR